MKKAQQEQMTMKDTKIFKLPKMNVQADVRAESFDEERNTIEVVFTTDAPVRRFSFFDGPFDEVLGMNPNEVRMERLQNGAPVLDNHNRFELSDQIGVVESASVDGQKGVAVLRLSKRESLREVVEDIRDGIIKNVSVGYKVHAMEKVKEEDGIPTLRAIDWEPMEISIVTVPADGNAQIRNEQRKEEETFDCEIRGISMEKETEKEKETEVVQERTEPEAEVKTETEEVEVKTEAEAEVEPEVEKEVQARSEEEITKAERTRISDITSLCKKFDIDEKEVKNFIENENSVEEVRAAVIEKLAERDAKKGTKNMNTNRIEVGQTDLEKKKDGLENAMLAKADIRDARDKKLFEFNENGNQYRYMSLTEMAKVVLEAKGIDARNMPKWQVAERALHSTSDFKEILANVLNKSLRQAYEASPQTFMPFTRMTEAPDLKEISRTQFGEGTGLEEIKEGEEYKHGTVSEGAEKYKIKKYGKIINVTEETLINDDLGAFTRIPAMYGQRARDIESDLAWGIVTSNPNMADGNALFSSAHGNLISAAGGNLQESSLSTGRSLFRKQVGLDGMKLNLSPVYLAVPEDLEVTGEKLLSSVQPESTSSFNPFGPNGRTPLSLIVEPRLGDASAQEWYLFGSLGQIDMIEMAMLEGAMGPIISQQEGFDVDGLRVKVKHWVGVKAIDWRGMLKSDGVS